MKIKEMNPSETPKVRRAAVKKALPISKVVPKPNESHILNANPLFSNVLVNLIG